MLIYCKKYQLFSLSVKESYWSRIMRGVLLQLVVLDYLFWLTSCSECLDSCYSFHNTSKNRFKSNDDCLTKNGSLISIETETEWQFITNEIQSMNMSEWFIGLSGSKWKPADGWKWENGKPLTISKWQSSQPSGDKSNSSYIACVVMAKAYPEGTQGLFNDISCDFYQRPYICEYTNEVASVSGSLKTICCRFKTTTPAYTTRTPVYTTTTPTYKTTTAATKQDYSPSTQAQGDSATTKGSLKVSSTAIVTDAMPTAEINAEAPQKKAAPTMLIIAIVLAIVLVIMICIFIVVCCRMKKRKGKHSTSLNRSFRTQVTDVNGSTSPNSAAQISPPETVIYAEVNNDSNLYTNAGYTAVKGSSMFGGEHAQPPPTPPIDYYSAIDETRTKTTENATYANGEVKSVEDPQNANAPAVKSSQPVYAKVDKSKKTSGKEAGVDIATGRKDIQNIDGTSDHNVPGTVSAVYAVVDKSKKNKGKKDGVGVGTNEMDANKGQKQKLITQDYIAGFTYNQHGILSAENVLYEGLSETKVVGARDDVVENPLYFSVASE